ncbi:monovalent cation/H(+) antiporter subunit G [Acuticoccus yangtzensis]|uniref:monovalent cation/H(+) antiporter subunit G n=1 Tax=Acuticoccus yangtzensis TaxID=1443441 RepID=UPI0009499CB1|nr:monovalent cation/H(+) antiporter subunit G [Acuticoccus yangtzensis]ORE96245.1 monovalent cation/H+ antiporter subunit G [Stappia sp. 22II-S9-Z10]
MTTLIPYVAGILCLLGAFFVLVAAIGLIRLDDLYMRMHAASKAGTVGVGGLFAALALYFGEADVAWRALAGFVFFLLTAPVSAHLLAKAAYTVGYKPCAQTKHDALSRRDSQEYTPT